MTMKTCSKNKMSFIIYRGTDHYSAFTNLSKPLLLYRMFPKYCAKIWGLLNLPQNVFFANKRKYAFTLCLDYKCLFKWPKMCSFFSIFWISLKAAIILPIVILLTSSVLSGMTFIKPFMQYNLILELSINV